MKIKVFVSVIAVLFILCAISLAAGEGPKIGVINMQKVLIESKAGKEAKSTLEKDIDAKRATLQAKEKEVQAIAADLNAKNVKLKPEDLAAKRDAYDKGVKELKRLKTDLEDDLKKTDSTVTAKVVKGVYEIARKMGEEKQLTMIIQGNPQIIYLDKTADITDEVIKRYDSQYGR